MPPSTEILLGRCFSSQVATSFVHGDNCSNATTKTVVSQGNWVNMQTNYQLCYAGPWYCQGYFSINLLPLWVITRSGVFLPTYPGLFICWSINRSADVCVRVHTANPYTAFYLQEWKVHDQQHLMTTWSIRVPVAVLIYYFQMHPLLCCCLHHHF